MLFNDLIHRRFISLLRPWLRDEPDLELKVGFLRSRGALKNVNFNTSALNQSLDDSARFRFKEVTVQQLSLCVSYWSSTTFTLGAQGLRVVLLLGEEEAEGGSLRRRRKPRDTSLEEKRRILAEIDPEGSVLHDVIKRISGVTAGSWKTNLLTTVLGHCQLEVDDIHILVLLPGSNDSFSCSLMFKELGAKSCYIGQTCFLRGFTGSFLLPSQKCSFDVDVKNFEVHLRNKSSSTSFVSAADISSSVTLENLRCTNFVLCLTSLRFSFSPADLAIVSLFYLLSSSEPRPTRTGSQLWRIAGSRISSLISTPKFSLYKVVSFVDVWLRYLRSYEHMLLLIGYPVCDMIKESAAMMFSDRTHSNFIKHQWDLISEFEYKLTSDAIVLARRIIRYRISESAQLAKSYSNQSYISKLLLEVYQLLALIWSIINHVLNLTLQFLFLQKAHGLVANHRQIDQCCKVGSDNSFPSCCICLNVEKFKISVSADNGVMPTVSEEQHSAIRFLLEDLIAFHLSSDALFLRCFDNLTEDGFMFSCGCIKVVTSSPLQDSSDNVGNLRRDHQEKEVPDSLAILRLEPAQVYTAENLANDAAGTSVPLLELILRRMWLNWKSVCSKFLGNDSELLQSPCILLESRHFLIDPSSKNITSGIFKGGMVVGKLHLMLEYSSIVSLAILFGQIQHAFYWDVSRTETNVGLHTSRTREGLSQIDFSSHYKSFASTIEETVLRMCPEKHMEVGVVVAGPKIQLSLRKEKLLGGKRDVHPISKKDELLLSVSIDDIELFLSPNSGSDSMLSCEHMKICDDESFGFRLRETQNSGILKSTNDINSCKRQISIGGYLKIYGLKASLSKLSHNSSYQFFMLRPATAQLTSSRKDCHSLGSKIVAVSTSLHWMASGFTALVFLDDMSVLAEAVSSLNAAVFHALSYFSSNGGSSCQELYRQEMAYTYSERNEMITNREKEVASPDCVVKHFAFKSTGELELMDMVLCNTRQQCHSTENYITHTDASSKVILDIGSMLDCGVHLFAQQACATFSFEGAIIKLLIDLIGVRSDIIKYSPEIVERLDQFDPRGMLSSLNCLCEASFSHCKLCLHLNISGKALLECSCSRDEGHPSTSAANSGMWGDSVTVMNSERSMNHFCHWFCTKIFISEIYLAECSIKNILVAKHRSNKLEASLSVGGQFQAICCRSKGGSVYLETAALFMFAQCIILYKNQIDDIWSAVSLTKKRMVAQYGETMVNHNCDTARDFQQLQHDNWEHLEALSISLSQLSLALVARDEIGKLQELLIEADVRLNLEVQNMLRKVFFEISKFSILSQLPSETLEQASKEIRIPHFPSITHHDLSFASAHGDCSATVEKRNLIESVIDDSSSKSPFPRNESYSDKTKDSCESVVGSEILNSGPQNYLLKEFCAFIAVECPVTRYATVPMHSDHVWVGNGSVSDFDMTISLTEIQAIIFVFESLSGILVRERTNNMPRSHLSISQESEGSLVEKLPDGTIVAIEDVYQHMYIAVENSENRLNLVGTMHYSLVGERSLFRVKHHNPGRWNPQTRFFSLISLYAKDESGQPLRLNSRSRSDFVDISGSYDSAWTFWTALPYKPEAYDGDSELESYHLPAKNTFYLVNKKNDRALAFIDGVLEFVAKPGNPFKFKVFHEFIPAGNGLFSDSYLGMALESGLPCNSPVTDEGELGNIKKVQGVTILINKVTLTIVHKPADTKEKFPLLQGTIGSTDVIVQVLNTKARFMCRLEVMLHHFDAQRNIWRELVHPLDICIFYRYRFFIGDSENDPGVRGHLHARIKELGISLTELSLDILLFVIGKLKLAGPFAVRNSAILANCCKVENRSGLTLHCQFFDNQYALVAGQQCTAIFLRHLSLANQPPEASVFSIRLVDQGSLSTSPLHLSLLEARAFAWRTCVISSQETKTSPGPFIVVEVSRRTEEGLSIVVSPLLRIHNETDFSMELRFQRPQQRETEFASLMLESGDSIDDSMAAFGATNLSGGLKKALMSLSVGNFLFSFRPRITDELLNCKISSVEWSDDLKGGKPVHLSSLFEKLAFQVRTAFSVESSKCSLGTAHCALKLEGGKVGKIYFLIQSVAKDVPIIRPDNFGYAPLNKNPSIALQEQKEIFLLPTVCVSNFLQTEIHVKLSDADPQVNLEFDYICSQATISCGASVNLYANPANIFFMVMLTAFDSSCKPVNSSEWVKKLQKQKSNAYYLDIELDFGGGKYFAFLRLSRGQRGTLEAAIFTSYALQNDTNSSLFCIGGNLKPLSRVEAEKLGLRIPPELGVYLAPKSTQSWFVKCHKVCVKLVEEKASEALLDLDALSGLTEIDLEVEERPGVTNVTKLGVSLKPAFSKSDPSNMVYVNPRHVILNQSGEVINIRQSYVEDDLESVLTVNSKQRTALKLQKLTRKKGEITIFEKLVRKHTKSLDDPLLFVQFQPNDSNFGWSGPVCVASLGQFFLKFRRLEHPGKKSDSKTSQDPKLCEYAAVHVVEEDSTLVLHFYKPPNVDLPYRIENCLRDAPITYHQKGSSEPDTLGSRCSVNYVWDDLTLPHKLLVQIDDIHIFREINLDKIRAWKPFYRTQQQRGLGFLLLNKTPGDKDSITGTVKLGYEVFAEGLTRVLRICEFSDSRKKKPLFYSTSKIRFRISYFSLQLLECAKQGKELVETSIYTPIISTRLENIDMSSIFTYPHKVNQINIQSLAVDQKWVGAPFSAVLRRRQSDYFDPDDKTLRIVLVLLSSSSMVKQIKYLSIILQPLDLYLDEETLMRIVPFWRTSLSDPNAPSQLYYFDHFEIHPIKIVASFLPRDSYASYSSTQEMLRSLLHSVIKIPTIKNKSVELNGVLVTHALITLHQLSIKCAQHYSWYALRAIYIAKGSPLLPPAFASIFDDFASSSLDVFFDPSSGLLNFPGLTMGTFKLISKCINGKGFSGTKRYFGDLGKTLKMAGSNIIFAAITEISDSVLKGAETNGFNGMVHGFHQGVLKLAMEPSFLGSAVMEGGPDRKIKLDRNPGVDELFIEGYLQALLDTIYKQEYLRVRVVDNQVILKNLPPNSSLINEIMERVKGFLVSKALLKGDSSTASQSLRHIRGETEWRIGPTMLTLCEHLFVSFAIRILRRQAGKVMNRVKLKEKSEASGENAHVPASSDEERKASWSWRWGIGKFVISGIVAYVDGRLCRCIPNPIARRVVSGFLLSFLENDVE